MTIGCEARKNWKRSSAISRRIRYRPDWSAEYKIGDGPVRGGQGRKTTPWCPRLGMNGCLNWSTFDAIAEFLEFPNHAAGADAFGFGGDRRTTLLVFNA